MNSGTEISVMREVRIFELDRPDAPVNWRPARTQTIAVQVGLLWVTREHQCQSIWFRPDQSIDVPVGVRLWLSDEPVEGTPARPAVTEDTNAPYHLLRFIGLVVIAAYRQILYDDGQDTARMPSAQQVGT